MANTYYFSTNGSDSSDGLSEDKPLKSLSNIGRLSIGPGTQILLRRGDSFSEAIKFDQSGTFDNKIEINCFGDENLEIPEIDTSIKFDGVWEKVQDSIPVYNHFSKEPQFNRSNDWTKWFDKYSMDSIYNPEINATALIAKSENARHRQSLYFYGVKGGRGHTFQFDGKKGNSGKLRVVINSRGSNLLGSETFEIDLLSENDFKTRKCTFNTPSGTDSVLIEAQLFDKDGNEKFTGDGSVHCYVKNAKFYEGGQDILPPFNIWKTTKKTGFLTGLIIGAHTMNLTDSLEEVYTKYLNYCVIGDDVFIKNPGDPNALSNRVNASYQCVVSKKASSVIVKNIKTRGCLYEAMLFEAEDDITITECEYDHCGSGFSVRARQTGSAKAVTNVSVYDNKVGRIVGLAKLNYDVAGILLRGVDKPFVRNNFVETVNAMGISVRDWRNGVKSNAPDVSHNHVVNSEGGISIWATPGAKITKNLIEDLRGYGIGIGGTPMDGSKVRSDNALLDSNIIRNLEKSSDGSLYNGIDVNAGAKNGRAVGNIVEKVAYHSMTLEGDNGEPSNGWSAEENVFDQRKADHIEGYDPIYTAENVDLKTLNFNRNLYLTNENRMNIVAQIGQNRNVESATWKTLMSDDSLCDASISDIFTELSKNKRQLKEAKERRDISFGALDVAKNLIDGVMDTLNDNK